MKLIKRLAVLLLLLSSILTSCKYSFKGISIPPEVDTFFVRQVKLTDFNAPPDSPERFMDQFRATIRGQSSLRWNEVTPDIEFVCTINGFRISNEGTQQGDEVSLNKLTISVNVDYINNKIEDDTWNKTFSFGIPFDPSQDLQQVQDDFIEDIFDQISENIFNEAFTNW
mgnify:CR=1 FL=1